MFWSEMNKQAEINLDALHMKQWTDMTPRERDATIAERVIGWQYVQGETVIINKETGERTVARYWAWVTTEGKEVENRHLPHYTTDIATAWQLIDRHPHYVSLVRSNDTGSRAAPWGPVSWRCRFYAPEKFEARAETAPEAICLAALKAKGAMLDTGDSS